MSTREVVGGRKMYGCLPKPVGLHRLFVTGLTILLVGPPGLASAQRAADSMTFRQARRIVESAAPKGGMLSASKIVRFRVTGETLNFLGTATHYSSGPPIQEQYVVLSLNEVQSVEAYQAEEANGWGVLIHLKADKRRGYRGYRTGYTLFWLLSDDADAEHDAYRFADALQWLVSHGSQLKTDPSAAEHFKARADEWRAAPVKPSIPEDARRHKVLAENAVQEKNFGKAIDEFEAALDIFPTWPEGQFNVALICGETGDYGCAVEHMQDYIELVPNAPNAQAAKDKLIIWKDKLGQSQ